MRKLILIFLLGCAHSPDFGPYQFYWNELDSTCGSSSGGCTVQDISLLLGKTPEACEPVPEGSQCSWLLDEGNALNSQGKINQYGGNWSTSKKEQFLRVSCRFVKPSQESAPILVISDELKEQKGTCYFRAQW